MAALGLRATLCQKVATSCAIIAAISTRQPLRYPSL
jgi:hypothetical protein